MRRASRGLERERAAISHNGLGDPALDMKDVAKVVLCLGIVGKEVDGALEERNRLGWLVEPAGKKTKPVKGFRKYGADRKGATLMAQRGGVLSDPGERLREVVSKFRDAGAEGDGTPQRPYRIERSRGCEQSSAEIAKGECVEAIDPQNDTVRFCFLVPAAESVQHGREMACRRSRSGG